MGTRFQALRQTPFPPPPLATITQEIPGDQGVCACLKSLLFFLSVVRATQLRAFFFFFFFFFSWNSETKI